MAGHLPAWDKVQELRSGKFSLLGDGSVRFVGPGLTQIVLDIAAHAKPNTISDVIVGPADAPGWKPLRAGEYSWAWQARRSPTGSVGGQATAILIGLLLPATDLFPLKGLQPFLASGARLHLVAGHKLTLETHVPAGFKGYDAGFTGGVFVAT